MLDIRTLAAVTAIALLAASTAPAKIMVVTYTGTVLASYDGTGEFGPPGGSLDGDAFTARYAYDTSVGARHTVAGVSDELHSGPFSGEPISVGAKLTIDGATWSFPGNYSGYASAETGSVNQVVSDLKSIHHRLNSRDIESSAFPSGAEPDLEATLPLAAGVLANGDFNIYDFNSDTDVVYHQAYGSFAIDTVRISAAVPEPASWALMLAGLGGLGAAMRHRRISHGCGFGGVLSRFRESGLGLGFPSAAAAA